MQLLLPHAARTSSYPTSPGLTPLQLITLFGCFGFFLLFFFFFFFFLLLLDFPFPLGPHELIAAYGVVACARASSGSSTLP